MSYNLHELPQYVNTAGKVTILTALSGVLIFAFVFLFNVGKTEFQTASAQSGYATTTLNVINTPPTWDINAAEETESSTTTPTNSGDEIAWIGTATDSNGAPYFLLICSNSASPTANAASGPANLGSAPPACDASATQWAVSASTTSGAQARAATTTTENAPFAEVQQWYAWVCDDDPNNPRCSVAFTTGYSATNSSPFHVNRRPSFTLFNNNSPTDPSANVTFYSTSTDPDVVGGADALILIVCSADTYSTSTNNCNPGDRLASTTITLLSDASATYTLPAIIQDQAYASYGYIVDEHGHEAVGGQQGQNVPYIVANVAPTVAGASIVLNDDNTIILDTPAGETSAQYTLRFTTADANSCDAVGGGNADEITNFAVGVFRSGVGSTTCDATDFTDPAATHNENNCYVSSYQPWNLTCTASSTTCTAGGGDDTMLWECTFPLWFIADPTDGATPFELDNWSAAAAGIDDDNATGTYSTSSTQVELQSFPALAMDSESGFLRYGSLEPGFGFTTLSTTTVVENQGNTGIDQNLSGESMCNTFTPSTLCPTSTNGTSTIPEFYQEFASTTPVSYGSGTDLSSTTVQQLELDVPKTTATSTLSTGTTYWGIFVPGTIQFSGAYTGLNTFGAVTAEPADW